MKFYVSRSVVINVGVDKIYDVLSDLRNWPEWSPWLKTEPEASVSYSDDGSRQEWKGELVGEGSMEIIEKNQNSQIKYQLNFIKPFKSQSEVGFSLEDSPNGVKVTWNMVGNIPFFLFFIKNSMVSFISMDYDRGLTMLKDLLETGELEFSVSSPILVESETIYYVGKKIMNCPLSEMSDSQPDYSLIQEDISKHSRPLEAVCVYHKFYLNRQTFDLTSGFMVSKETMEAMSSSTYDCGVIEGGKSISVSYKGSYSYIGNAWSAAMAFARYKKHKVRKNLAGYEIHKKNPLNTDNPKDYLTDIVVPIR